MGLRQHVTNPCRLADRPNCSASNDTCARARGQHDHLGCPAESLDSMRDGSRFNWHFNEILHAILDGFFDGGRHFVCLAVAAAHLATAISYHNQTGKTKTPTTLDHGRATTNLHDLFGELAAPGLATSGVAAATTAGATAARSTATGIVAAGISVSAAAGGHVWLSQ